VLPKGFEGDDICAYYERAWKQKLSTYLLQLSISELWACRKIINCEHVGLKKKIGKCVQLDVKWEHDVSKIHPMFEVRGNRA
jgi:hypothetical protein